MNHQTILLGVVTSFFATGCAPYRGAVYSEYTQVGLDIRVNTASSTPIVGALGYDHGIGSYVPRRNCGTNGSYGESVSVISWNYTGAEFNPLAPTNSTLTMDAGFISGTAAAVAATPSDSVINIVGINWHTNTAVVTEGNGGDRIAAASAIAPATLRVVPPELQSRRQALYERLVGMHSDTNKLNQVLRALHSRELPPDQAFRTLKNMIFDAQSEDSVNNLEQAFKTVLP